MASRQTSHLISSFAGAGLLGAGIWLLAGGLGSNEKEPTAPTFTPQVQAQPEALSSGLKTGDTLTHSAATSDDRLSGETKRSRIELAKEEIKREEAGLLQQQSGAPDLARRQSLPRSVLELLDRLDQLPKDEALEEAVTTLAFHGEDVVQAIRDRIESGNPSFGWVHRAVSVLAEEDGRASQALMREIALARHGVDNPSLQALAARRLLETSPTEAVELLASENPQVDNVSLNQLVGQRLDRPLYETVRGHLNSDDMMVRWQAADAMAREPSGFFGFETSQAIGGLVEQIADLPDVDAIYQSSRFTLGEINYDRYIRTLSRSTASNADLSRLAGQAQDRVQDVAWLAQARRGDISVAPQIRRLARDPDAGMFRAWAAQALAQIGSDQDLPLLSHLAQNDLLVRNEPVGGPPGSPTTAYPVREAARSAILEVKGRSR